MNMESITLPEWMIGVTLIASSLGVITLRKPVHACLSFLLALLMLAGLYLQLSADFIAVMQVLVYAGAILVIFMFVIVLFQNAHAQVDRHQRGKHSLLLVLGVTGFALALAAIAPHFFGIHADQKNVPEGFGTVQSLGYALYIDFFFPFEAVVLLFLIALVGALYIGRKSTN